MSTSIVSFSSASRLEGDNASMEALHDCPAHSKTESREDILPQPQQNTASTEALYGDSRPATLSREDAGSSNRGSASQRPDTGSPVTQPSSNASLKEDPTCAPHIFLTKWTHLSTTNPDALPFPPNEPPFALTEIDNAHLRLTDAQFQPHTWADLTHLIESGQLDALKRWPSHLKAYLEWCTHVKERYGGVLEYILRQRLGWEMVTDKREVNGDAKGGHDSASNTKTKTNTTSTSGSKSNSNEGNSESTFPTTHPAPYAHASDFSILPNDWPYAVEPGVTHLVAWSKHRLPVDAEGALTPAGFAIVEDFITREFRVKSGEEKKGEKVLWFRNPRRLQSVRSLEHVHVLVRE